MREHHLVHRLWAALSCGVLAVSLAGAGHGCSYGAMTETIAIEETRDLSGIATPGSGIPQHPNLHDRASWGAFMSYASLGYENASADVEALFDFADPTVVIPPPIEAQSPLQFFGTPHTDEEGVGPLFNQRACIGCHNNSVQNQTNLMAGGNDAALAAVNTANTPVSRGGRQGPTDYPSITKLAGNPPTVAFTLYGDYNPSTGAFNPLSVFGGPLQHDDAIGYCAINPIPSISIDPNLAGGLDPVTGLSPFGERRTTGERAAPPYVGRGLIEAIYFGDILANEDPDDQVDTYSSLPPRPGASVCPNDCISGRHNESAASQSFVGGDPLVRVGRFGLRGAGTTLIQFVVGGSQGELGLTSPFAPFEQPNVDTVDPTCNAGGPTPNITATRVETVRDLIRNIAPPVQASTLYEDPPRDTDSIAVQAGAKLFGLDLDAFRARMTSDDVDPANYSDETNHALANDHQLGCATCHIPVFRTGVSPAQIGGAENLSNRWAPIFSDLPHPPEPGGAVLFPAAVGQHAAEDDRPGELQAHVQPGPARRRAVPIPGQRQPQPHGLRPRAERHGPRRRERVSNAAAHGARQGGAALRPRRAHLSEHHRRGQLPGRPAEHAGQHAVHERRRGHGGRRITTMDLAVLAAIEMHDLPAPPINPATNAPDYKLCPIVTQRSTSAAARASTGARRATRWRSSTPSRRRSS